MDSGAATIVCAQLDTSKGQDAPVRPDSQPSHLQRWLRVLPCEQISVLRQDLLSKHTPCVLQGKSTRLEGSTLWKKSATKTSKACRCLWFATLCLLLSWPVPQDRKDQLNRVGSSPAPAGLGPAVAPATPW